MIYVSYTLDDLRNKYVRVDTPEYEVFMDACEWLGVTWPSGKKPREEVIDDDFVSFDSLDGNLGSCGKDFYIYAQEYSQFIPKTNVNVVDIAEEIHWTVYNNTLPMSELTDEQAVDLFVAWRKGGVVLETLEGVTIETHPTWEHNSVYAIKCKSDSDLFVEKMLSFYKHSVIDDKVIDMLKEAYDNSCRFV